MTDYKHLAEAQARLSPCNRRRVGAVIVHPVGWVFLGYNRALDGGPCECEQGVTRSSVVHAEEAAIWSAHSVDLAGSVLYVTHQPCINCAMLIVANGIRAVHYRDADDKQDGLHELIARGIRANRWPTQQQVDREFFAKHGGALGPRELEALGGHPNRIIRGMD
jgi:dCMP deaminase